MPQEKAVRLWISLSGSVRSEMEGRREFTGYARAPYNAAQRPSCVRLGAADLAGPQGRRLDRGRPGSTFRVAEWYRRRLDRRLKPEKLMLTYPLSSRHIRSGAFVLD